LCGALNAPPLHAWGPCAGFQPLSHQRATPVSFLAGWLLKDQF